MAACQGAGWHFHIVKNRQSQLISTLSQVAQLGSVIPKLRNQPVHLVVGVACWSTLIVLTKSSGMHGLSWQPSSAPATSFNNGGAHHQQFRALTRAATWIPSSSLPQLS
jgi:hypothetical protein